MFIYSIFFKKQSLIVLAICMVISFLVGNLQQSLYKHYNVLDCSNRRAKNHPYCEDNVVLYVNGNIHTLSYPQLTEAMAVSRGIIIDLGKTNDILAKYPSGVKVDLYGKDVYPGFFDSHVHLLAGGLGLVRLNLTMATTLSKFHDSIIRFTEKHSSDPWIIGAGWMPSSTGGYPPQRLMLDSIVSSKPMFLWDRSHKVAAVNSLGLKLLDIDKKTKDPIGGIIVRDKKERPTGILLGSAVEVAYSKISKQIPGWLKKQALLAAQEEFLSLGITRVNNQPSDDSSELVSLGELQYDGLWRLRVNTRPNVNHNNSWALKFYRSSDSGTLSVGAPLFVLDGEVLQNFAMFNNTIVKQDLTILSDSDLKESLTGLNLTSSGALFIANNEHSQNNVLSAINSLSEKPKLPVIYSQLWNDSFIKNWSRNSGVALISPTKIAMNWELLRPLFDEVQFKSYVKARSLITNNIPIVIGSSWPESPANPFFNISSLIEHEKYQDDYEASIVPAMPDYWHQSEFISIEDAVNSYIATPSKVFGTIEKEGSLAINKYADFVVVDKSLTKENNISKILVIMTVIGGEVVWRRDSGLQFYTKEIVLKESPSYIKVIARQNFYAISIFVGLFSWPLITLMLWLWRHRPRPKPLKVIIKASDISDNLKRKR